MLKSLFRPRWQHSNVNFRAVAVEKLTPDNADILRELAVSDPESSIRLLAMGKITDSCHYE